MGRKTYTAEQVINKLREVEILISQGTSISESSRRNESFPANQFQYCVSWQNIL